MASTKSIGYHRKALKRVATSSSSLVVLRKVSPPFPNVGSLSLLRPFERRPIAIDSCLFVDEAASVPCALLPAESTTAALRLCASRSRGGATCAEKDCGNEVAGDGCPHEAEIVFAETGGHTVRFKGVATFNVCGAGRDNISGESRRDQR